MRAARGLVLIVFLAAPLACGEAPAPQAPAPAAPAAWGEADLFALIWRVSNTPPSWHAAEKEEELDRHGAAAFALALRRAAEGRGPWAQSVDPGRRFLGEMIDRGLLEPNAAALWELTQRGDDSALGILALAGPAALPAWIETLDDPAAAWRAVDVAWRDPKEMFRPLASRLEPLLGAAGEGPGRKVVREARLLAMLGALTPPEDRAELRERLSGFLAWRRDRTGGSSAFLGGAGLDVILAHLGDGAAADRLGHVATWEDQDAALRTVHALTAMSDADWTRGPGARPIWRLLEVESWGEPQAPLVLAWVSRGQRELEIARQVLERGPPAARDRAARLLLAAVPRCGDPELLDILVSGLPLSLLTESERAELRRLRASGR